MSQNICNFKHETLSESRARIEAKTRLNVAKVAHTRILLIKHLKRKNDERKKEVIQIA